MKMSIKQRRLERAWSQGQLAEFSGLSLRTIQRLEKGGRATQESQKALAAVFEISVGDLQGQDEPIDETTLDPLQREALDQIRQYKEFVQHLATFFVIVPLLVLANWLFDPDQVWSGLAALGWGIWLAVQAFRVFEVSDFLGADWERSQLAKRVRPPGRK